MENIGSLRRLEMLENIAFADLMLAQIALVDALKKYNSSQPRAPRGTPNGGQWIAVGGGSSSTKPKPKRVLPKVGEVIKVPDKSGSVPNKVNIFIGGGGDQTSHGNVGLSDSLHQNIYGENYYYAHDAKEDIETFIVECV